MKLVFKLLFGLLLAAIIGAVVFYFFGNRYQRDGQLSLSILDQPVTVSRDALAIPYIRAKSLADGLRAQGFITGQDRLYQAQLYRLLALGRLSEVFGERGIASDTLIRVIGIEQIAARYLETLDSHAKNFYTHYIQGLNAYILEQQHEHPLSVKLLGIKPEPWTLRDIVAIQFFQAWSNGSTWRMDLLSQQLVDHLGPERAQQISQVSVNPDDGSIAIANLLERSSDTSREALDIVIDPALLAAIPNPISAGSNAWATGSKKSAGGKPIFANSPHLPATTLPGFWHPMAILTPNLKAVGLSSPGSPGIGIGRTQHIAYGATVGGSDGADLYIEQLDVNKTDHYLEGERSIAMKIRNDSFLVKDKTNTDGFRVEKLRIRSTKRGPIVSDHGVGMPDGRALSLRWSVADTTSSSLGSDRLLVSKSLSEARTALKSSHVALSHVIVDAEGGIGRVSSGRVPIRTVGDGAIPLQVSELASIGFDNWLGLIPSDDMPVELSPEKDWVGTANHRIIPEDFPYQFSKIFAASWRYRRIKEFMQQSDVVSVDDHWALINDVKNPMADKLLPLFIDGFKNSGQSGLVPYLQQWDKRDTVDQIAPSLFQLTFKHLVELTFKDELTDEIWPQFFDAVYFWQERLMLMLKQKDHPWFDLKGTDQVETLDEILNMSIKAAIDELTQKLGTDPKQWQWGKLHTITFGSPIIPGKAAAKWIGAGTHPMFGSGETLNRGKFKYSDAYQTSVIDSVRLVIDMADDEKVLATIPGGTSGRYFDPSLANQTEAWLAGDKNFIWFSDGAIERHKVSELKLTP